MIKTLTKHLLRNAMPPPLCPTGAGPIPAEQGVLQLLHTRNLHLTSAASEAGQEAVMTACFQRWIFIWTETLCHFPHHSPSENVCKQCPKQLENWTPPFKSRSGFSRPGKVLSFNILSTKLTCSHCTDMHDSWKVNLLNLCALLQPLIQPNPP